jgi:SNF2 family DNA or RNA helicase
MALRLDPVRLLIADDVGVGKTIEAGMIARELLDRGIAKRLGVITPAHLCDQWQRELAEKFGINSALVQPSQMARLEREMPRQDVTVFAHYLYFVGSIDFLKSERHRGAFIRDAPDLIIVDEAHLAARPRGATNIEHQRFALLHDLAADPSRHIILVTATPHSGIEESFRSLLGLLRPAFESETDKKKLLPHIIQRRRKDVEKWLGSETPFPERIPSEERYELGSEYRRLFEDVLEYCRETVETGGALKAAQQRVRHWAAIAILRCLLSSPAAAASVLAARVDRMAKASGDESEQEIDASYRPQVLDALGDEETADYAPTAPLEDVSADWTDAEQRRLLRFRDRARELRGPDTDRKLARLIEVVKALLREDGSR